MMPLGDGERIRWSEFQRNLLDECCFMILEMGIHSSCTKSHCARYTVYSSANTQAGTTLSSSTHPQHSEGSVQAKSVWRVGIRLSHGAMRRVRLSENCL